MTYLVGSRDDRRLHGAGIGKEWSLIVEGVLNGALEWYFSEIVMEDGRSSEWIA